uniref:Membrane magnesium transporter 1 n=1 Tax=Anser brachyrhynchus TaxID=132585 RepID=A0A8B9C517_9AVES
MRLTEKEDETLPIDIVLQTLLAFAVTCYGIVHIAGEFKDMDATSELKNKYVLFLLFINTCICYTLCKQHVCKIAGLSLAQLFYACCRRNTGTVTSGKANNVWNLRQS